MRTSPRFASALLTLSLVFLPSVVGAQASLPPIDEAKLTKLFETYVAGGKTDQLTEKKIAAERQKIRLAIEAELDRTVSIATQVGSGSSLTDTLERQRTFVTSLQTQHDELAIDLDLVRSEEQAFLQTASGGVLPAEAESYPELLTKKLILEERVGAVADTLAVESERLSKLALQQRIDQFTKFVGFGKYVLLVLVFILVEQFVRKTLLTRIQNRNRRYAFMKVFTATIYIVMTLLLLVQLSAEHPGFLTSFAIVGAGVAIALQDLIKDFFGWLLIVQKRMFGLGQRITIGPYTGDIIDISLLRTTLLEVNNAAQQDVGRIGQTLYLPNSLFLREPVLNFHATSDFVEAEITLTVSSLSSWKEADRILREILHEETDQFTDRARRQTVSRTQHFYVSQDARGARVFMDISKQGIQFTLRYLVPIGERRLINTKLTGLILDRFEGASPAIRLVFDPVPR